MKQKLWGDLLSFQPMVGYGSLTNLNIFVFSLKAKFACEYITSILHALLEVLKPKNINVLVMPSPKEIFFLEYCFKYL